ncbi:MULTISPECIES: hypothetical protein [Rhizobium]|nr:MULTISPECIES: hypothetical protein [Rhizobium]
MGRKVAVRHISPSDSQLASNLGAKWEADIKGQDVGTSIERAVDFVT